MQLEELTLSCYRNIERLELQFHPRFNIFYGKNAQGKTNLLEAIHLLGSLKSFRGARNEELIQNSCELARLCGKSLQGNGVYKTLQIDVHRNGKAVRLNGKILGRPDEYLNCLRPIVFAPEEVGLVKGGPQGRRRLIDRAVFMSWPGYLIELQQYERVLKQRNRLLKDNKSAAELQPWSEALAQSGARIRHARSVYLTAVAQNFAECHAHISQMQETAQIRYRQGLVETPELEQELRDDLEQQYEQERRYGITLSGPHRDDIHFLLDGRSLRIYGSQGQQRSFVLALKTAQALDLEQRHGEPPLLLLDDFLGELDAERQTFFFNFLRERSGQVFITATDATPLRQGGLTEGYYYRVENGYVHPEA
jgi:DNA replication and repair protein RecF